jgi:hypothetical protein
MEPRNRFQGMNSASLCSLAGRYDNPFPPRFLAPIDSLKIPAPITFTVILFQAPRLTEAAPNGGSSDLLRPHHRSGRLPHPPAVQAPQGRRGGQKEGHGGQQRGQPEGIVMVKSREAVEVVQEERRFLLRPADKKMLFGGQLRVPHGGQQRGQPEGIMTEKSREAGEVDQEQRRCLPRPADKKMLFGGQQEGLKN